MRIEDLTGPATPVADADVRAAASVLGVSKAVIQAVMAVESNGRGFHPESKRPVILFEPHIFHRETQGRFSASHPAVSYAEWGEHPYPATQGQRYAQLGEAMRLDETAALKSASWGLFQIMGFNFGQAGFDTVQGYVAAMVRGEGDQLLAFARFVGANPEMAGALRRCDWAGFARRYNGKSYARHGYDQKLKAAYARAVAA